MDANWNLERVSDRGYGSLSLVIDSAGWAHFVATELDGIVYWTNAGGQWTHQRIGTPADGHESDRNATIAIDEIGQLVVAYARLSCLSMGCGGAQVFVTVKESSGWSTPDLVAVGMSPSVASASGVTALSYVATLGVGDVACEEPRPIDYATSTATGWQIHHVAPDGGLTKLALAPDGTPHVLLDDECGPPGGPGIYVASPNETGGTFVLDGVPGTRSGNANGYALAVDDGGRDHVLDHRYDSGYAYDPSYYVVRDDGVWNEPVDLLPERAALAMAVDGSGKAHFLGQGDDGTWHATNAGGDFTFDRITPNSSASYPLMTVALDGDGQPHVLFVTGGSRSGPTTWYGVLATP